MVGNGRVNLARAIGDTSSGGITPAGVPGGGGPVVGPFVEPYTAAAACTWTGATNTAWTTGTNWSCAHAPTSSDDVVITSSGTNNPTISTSTTILSLSVSTKTLTITGGTFTVLGNVTINSTITMSGGSTLNVGGNLTNNGSLSADGSNGNTVTFNGTSGAQTLGGTGTTTLRNLTINPSSGGTVTLAQNVTLNSGSGGGGVLSLTVSSGTLDLGAFTVGGSGSANRNLVVSSGAKLRLGGAANFPSFDNYTLDPDSTVEYSAAGAQTISSAPSSYGNLTTSGSGNKTAAAALTVNSDLTIGSGTTFVTGLFAHSLKGDVANNGSFTATAGSTVTFNGSTAQTITGTPPSFQALTLNNSNGLGFSGATGNMTVAGTLTFTSGKITTGANTLIASGTVTGAAASRFVEGNLRKPVATGSSVTRTFEVGTGTTYSPVTTLFASVSVAGNLTVTPTSGDHPSITTSLLDPNHDVNRYWTITNGGVTFTTYSPTFTFVAGDLDAGANTAAFLVKRFAASAWTSNTTGTLTSTTSQATGVSGFGEFAVGQAAPNPAISSLSPSSLGQGATAATVTVNGSNFLSGAVVSISGTGLTVGATTFVNAGQLTVLVSVDGNATTGARTLTVTNPNSTTGTSTLTVNAAATVTSLNPSSEAQGATSQVVTVNGTNFVAGVWANSSVSFSGTGITVNSVTRSSAIALSVNLTVGGAAATGARDVTVTSPDFAPPVTLVGGFTVNTGATVTTLSPSSLGQGATTRRSP